MRANEGKIEGEMAHWGARIRREDKEPDSVRMAFQVTGRASGGARARRGVIKQTVHYTLVVLFPNWSKQPGYRQYEPDVILHPSFISNSSLQHPTFEIRGR